MTRIDDIVKAIGLLPSDCEWIKFRMHALLGAGELDKLMAYATGVKDTMEAFTSDATYLAPARRIVEILK